MPHPSPGRGEVWHTGGRRLTKPNKRPAGPRICKGASLSGQARQVQYPASSDGGLLNLPVEGGVVHACKVQPDADGRALQAFAYGPGGGGGVIWGPGKRRPTPPPFGMTTWCILVCGWRRQLADSHLLPFPWTGWRWGRLSPGVVLLSEPSTREECQ